ncbi:MAG: PDZ domain-containing protein [Planctomycetaceae bacterium]
MIRLQTRTAAGLLLPLSLTLACSRVASGDEPTPAPRQEQRVEVRVESRSSSTNGDEPQVKREGRIIVIGPDGVKKEYDLNAPEGRALILDMEGGLDALKILDGQPPAAAAATAEAAAPQERVMLGVACEEAPTLLRKHLKLNNSGLVVLSVSENSPAAEALLEPDDVLISLNDRQLSTIPQLMEVVAGLEGKPSRLQIIRSGTPMEISVTPRKIPVPEVLPAAKGLNPGDLENMRLPGLNQQLNRMFPGVIIDEQFPADPQAMERMLKKLSTLARDEARRAADGAPASASPPQPEIQQQLQQLREELQQLRRDLQGAKKN